MKNKRLNLSILFLFAFFFTGIQAQESINAAGGNASGAGGSVSWSSGQVTYQTNSGTTGSIAEGVQQPYEISVVTALDIAKGINLAVS
ncbi:MAG: T9SS C-terminal target domain-containing protein, partial [Bacteroidales bacterium]|nr:T9SS C-terminal target domain-containing protein [Bacteroidales bacterium]